MRVVCAGGDPGGSRCVLAVAALLAELGDEVHVMNYGFLGRESAHFPVHLVAEDAFSTQGMDCFCYGSSSTDTYALQLSEQALVRGIPVVHVCDNWSSYRKRITLGDRMLAPDVYCCMDQHALQDAIQEGIPPESLVVTGQPALARDLEEASTKRHDPVLRQRYARSGHPVFVFVSEPYRKVMGADTARPDHCGFTEYEVLPAFADALRHICPEAFVYILPHPKHDKGEMEQLWEAVRGNLHGEVVHSPLPRDLFAAACGFAGMGSILLYEAWVLGYPVLSLQPDCRIQGMRRFAQLEHGCYASDTQLIPQQLAIWYQRCLDGVGPPRPEYAIHRQSTRKIAEIIHSLHNQR